MFNLFRKKQAAFPLTDRVFLSGASKEAALVRRLEADPDVIFIHWFDESLERSVTVAGDRYTHRLLSAREAMRMPPGNPPVIFAEHYPLRKKEEELFQRLGLTKVEVWSALDDPLLKKFGGDRIIEMMRKMGMKDDEIIEHALISKSIRNAQDKLEKKLVYDSPARSAEEWFRRL